jgi:hypothetical protein
MGKLAKSLILLAVASHVGFTGMDAYARGGGGGGDGHAFGGFSGASRFSAAPTYYPQGGFNSDRPSQAPIGIVVTGPRGPTEGGQYPNRGGDRPPPRRFHPGFGGFAPVEFDEPPSSGDAGGDGGECAGGLQLTEIDTHYDALNGLAKISRETDRYIDLCGGASQTRIADALDRYAEALTEIAPRLPPSLHSLPQIVAAAAHRARVAPTKHAAAHALRAAVVAIQAAVHKSISLIRASDPDATSVATRGGDLVAKTLSTAASALERADSL